MIENFMNFHQGILATVDAVGHKGMRKLLNKKKVFVIIVIKLCLYDMKFNGQMFRRTLPFFNFSFTLFSGNEQKLSEDIYISLNNSTFPNGFILIL